MTRPRRVVREPNSTSWRHRIARPPRRTCCGIIHGHPRCGRRHRRIEVGPGASPRARMWREKPKAARWSRTRTSLSARPRLRGARHAPSRAREPLRRIHSREALLGRASIVDVTAGPAIDVAGLLPTGGASRRLGRDKGLVDLDRRSLAGAPTGSRCRRPQPRPGSFRTSSGRCARTGSCLPPSKNPASASGRTRPRTA